MNEIASSSQKESKVIGRDILKSLKRGTNLYTYSTLIGLRAIALFFNFLTDGLLISPRNIVNLVRQISINGILAVGMTMLLLSGNIDLSVGSGVALITVAASIPQVWYQWGAIPAIFFATNTAL